MDKISLFKFPRVFLAKLIVAVLLVPFAAPLVAFAAPAVNFDQAHNGSAGSPTSPVNWVNGNANSSNSHYVEGESIPYRIVFTELAAGAHTLEIEWDIRDGGKNAIDYITSYDRIDETVNPIQGVTGVSGSPSTFAIPAPSSTGSTVAGQPTASFNSLPAIERMMAIWGGTITGISYVFEGSLSDAHSSTRLLVNFTSTEPTVVIAWGGHIASESTWGEGNSAADISGSPYHTNLYSLDGDSTGHQDRSLKVDANGVEGEEPNADINLTKTASVSTLPIGGGSVTYTMTVTNGGNVTLSNIVMSDPDCTPINLVSGGDANSNNMLEVSETWVYTCVKNITATKTNTATVTGVHNNTTVTATASATVTVELAANTPIIHIEKTANPTTLPSNGGSVTYTMTVTNIGNVTLSSVVVSDPNCSPVNLATGGDANNNNMLEVSETWVYTCTKNVTATGTNTATVTASTSDGRNVSDEDSATVTVTPAVNASINLTKTASVSNLPAGGGSVTYTMTVTNPGNATITNVVISDPDCSPLNLVSGGDANDNDQLEVSETWVYTCVKNVTVSGTNTATVTGKVGDINVSDTASATVTVVAAAPQISIVKSANVSNLPAGGGNVTYTMTVSNPGNVALSNIVLSDPNCSPISNPNGDANNNNMLEIGELWVYTCVKNLTANTTNTATVTGVYNNQTVTDTASVTVNVGQPAANLAIDLAKVANVSNLPAGGGNVVYTLTVKNLGNVTLQNIVLSDVLCNSLSSASGDANNNNMLEVSETWTYTCNRNLNASTTNVAVVSGSANGSSVTDSAFATVNVPASNNTSGTINLFGFFPAPAVSPEFTVFPFFNQQPAPVTTIAGTAPAATSVSPSFVTSPATSPVSVSPDFVSAFPNTGIAPEGDENKGLLGITLGLVGMISLIAVSLRKKFI